MTARVDVRNPVGTRPTTPTMPRHRLYLALIVLLVVRAFAHAVPARDPRRELAASMRAHVAALAALRAQLADAPQGRGSFTCELALRSAHDAGLPGSLVLTWNSLGILAKSYRDSRGVHLRLADAPSLCEELARWEILARAQVAVRAAYRTIKQRDLDRETAASIASTCRARVDEATAAGFAPQTALPLARTLATTLARATADICDPLARTVEARRAGDFFADAHPRRR